MKKITIRFYSNDTEESREILQLLMEAEIPYINLGPVSELQTPSIQYGHWEYHGLKSIKNFIENNWKTGKLPRLD